MKYAQISQTVEKLKAGQIVAIPTETVYGLAVDANNLEAVAKLYHLKNRSEQKPFAIAIANPEDVTRWVDELNEDATILIQSFWPGPLTLVLPAAKNVAPIINAGRNNIGIRCSSAKTLHEIITLLGNAICLTSANLSGEPERCTAEQIRMTFKDEIFVCEENQNSNGMPSTVLDLSASPYKILRETIISLDEIQVKIKRPVIR